MITHEGIICQLKFLNKIVEISLFLEKFLSNLQEKSYVIWEFLVVGIVTKFQMLIFSYFRCELLRNEF